MRAIILLTLLLACGSPTDLGPPQIIIESVHLQGSGIRTTLRNDGGPGQYHLEFWALPTTPNGAKWLAGDTQTVDVTSAYSESVTWPSTGFLLTHIDAYTRGTDTAVWAWSSRWEF